MLLTTHINKADKQKRPQMCWYCRAKVMVASYRNVTNYTVSFDSAAGQIQLIYNISRKIQLSSKYNHK